MLDTDIVARVIANIGRTGFDAAYLELARKTLDVSSCSAFFISDTANPAPIVLEGFGEEHRSKTKDAGSTYVESGFRDDPFLKSIGAISDLYVRLVSPQGIGDHGYRKHYYEDLDIVSEINVLGRVGRKRFNIGFYRISGKKSFSEVDLEAARMLAKISLPVLSRHLELSRADPEYQDAPVDTPVAPGAAAGKPVLEHLSAVLMAEGHGLTPREAQICASIVLGYRTLAISLNLGISENTICTHRKRAYAKLGISSQNELFSRYFRTVTRFTNQAA
ncbi:DNA-binding protein with HTH domain [Caulobacter sp. AP07]|uniref:helix-turn-helix transcriptional regulator n=1 Tax=Caulobacter sp. AP07 TaxID=1144304 RepID=UPI0002720C67|nr:helix-turn-helix transcriptional regulator [Caulobacter sp. AP07]EJL27348.1 DNA-binding protein with HTH domain [Caulobacter sp. AP07]